jgi:PcfJ-like protein
MNKIARSPLQERLHKSAEQDASLQNILRETKKRGKRRVRMLQEINHFLGRGDGQYEMLDGRAVDLGQFYNFSHFKTVEAQDFLQPIVRQKTLRMFQNPDILRGLLMASMFKNRAVRSLQNWQPRFNCPERMFNDLIRYLFVQYRMPHFFYSAFKTYTPQQVSWFIDLAQGTSVRTLNLPIPLSARGMHFFLQAPPQYSVSQAVRFGQILGLGGDAVLANNIMQTRLGSDFSNPKFWTSVIQFLIKNKGLSFEEVREIIGFCYFVKFQVNVFRDGENPQEWVTKMPPMPDFSLKGRNVASLFRLMLTFEHEIKRCENLSECIQTVALPTMPFGDFETTIVTENKVKRQYFIRQITNDVALMMEGRVMSHCVYTYLKLCREGRSSIWTLAYTEGSSVLNKTLTIEIRGNQIVQIRGKVNRLATDLEMDIIKKWAAMAGLRVWN